MPPGRFRTIGFFVTLADYLPVLIQIVLAIGMGVGILVASHAFGQKATGGKIKDSPYECGLAADTTTSLRALGHDIHPEDFVQALLPVVHRTLGTTSENR